MRLDPEGHARLLPGLADPAGARHVDWNRLAAVLEAVEDGTVDVVVMDPPYYDNVMYAELSDFFYVWLKRTAGQVIPDLFT